LTRPPAADLSTGQNSFAAVVTDKAGNTASVAGATATVNGANSIALSGGKSDQIVIANAGGNSTGVTGETSDRFVYEETLTQYDTITGFAGGSAAGYDIIDLAAIAGALAKGLLNADSVGWVYSASANETLVYVNNTGAAEPLTGVNAAAPMLELAGDIPLTRSSFALAKA
jgi:hypothetical protein